MTEAARVLTVVVCGAGPASEVGQLIKLAQEQGWSVQVIATPAALDFLDVPALETQTGSPVRSQYRSPGEPRSRPADAIIVAPATYNTINKWARGISDTRSACLPKQPLSTFRSSCCPSSTRLWPPALRSAAASRTCAAKESASCSGPAVWNP
jgi:hypothetical protein